jgi:hypothetical protein
MSETEPIRPYAGGEPGGALPHVPVRIPVEGGQQIVLTPEAQRAAKAAEELSSSNQIFTDSITKPRGANRLDDVSQARLNEVRSELRSNPRRPATIINLHPWPLTFGYGDLLLRGITVPACPLGQEFIHYHIRASRVEWEYEENGTLKYKPVSPIRLAGEFVREFSNKDNDGGGVLIYEGETHPHKMGMIELYDDLGRPKYTSKLGIEYDEENQAHQVEQRTPIVRPFAELLKEYVQQRNQVYFRKVQAADRDYKLPDGRGKWLIHEKHRLMAEVLYAEGLITKVPEWNLSSRMEEGLSSANCKACGEPIKESAYKCFKCNNIVNVVEAFRDGASIPEAKFELCTSDELDEIEQIKEERRAAQEQAAERKAKPKTKKS